MTTRTSSGFDPAEAREAIHTRFKSWGMLRALHAQLGKPMTMVKCTDEFLAEYGEDFTERFILPKHLTHPESQECYWNAWTYKLHHETADNPLTYCEGHVALEGVPISVLHGWCVDAKGHVHDPSVHQHEGAAYVGMRYSDKFARETWRELHKQQWIGILANIDRLGLRWENLEGHILSPRRPQEELQIK